MDRFSEQLLRKEPTGRDMFKRGLYIAAALVLLFLDVWFVAGFGLIVIAVALAAGIIWGLVWLLQGTQTEYEYIVTNDDLDIDKIIGRRKRKRLMTVSLKSVISIEPYNSGGEIVSDVVVMAHDETGVDMYCLVSDSEKFGKTAVIFNPDGRTLYNMIGGFSSTVRNNYRELYRKLAEKEAPDEDVPEEEKPDVRAAVQAEVVENVEILEDGTIVDIDPEDAEEGFEKRTAKKRPARDTLDA